MWVSTAKVKSNKHSESVYILYCLDGVGALTTPRLSVHLKEAKTLTEKCRRCGETVGLKRRS